MKPREDAQGEKNSPGAAGPGDGLSCAPGLMQAILDSAQGGMAVADSAGRIIFSNAALREILGGPVTDAASCPRGACELLRLDGSPVPPRELPLFRALEKGETNRGMEILVRRGNGSEAVVLASAGPILDGKGGILGAVAAFQDITEQKRTEQALKESRERVMLAQQAGHVGMFRWDMATRTGTLNPEFLEFLGLPPDYPVSLEDWGRITPPEDVDKVLRALEEAAGAHCPTAEAEYRVFHPEGGVSWISIRGVIHYDSSGAPDYIMGSAIDITDLKMTQEALHRANEGLARTVAERTAKLERVASSLKNQKELLQTIIDSIPVIVTVWKPPLQLVMANKEFERLSGWTQEEASTLDILAASFPDPAYRRQIVRQVSKAQPGWGEFFWTTQSGRVLTIAWAASDLSDGSRIGIGIDVTGQRKMEKDMLRLAAAIDQAGEGIVLFSTEWIIEYVNPAYEKLTGYSREELLGRDVGFLSSHLAGGSLPLSPYENPSRVEIRSGSARRKSGEVIDVHLTMSPVRDAAGAPINYVAIVQDVTEEARLQQMVIQAQRMEAIGSLAGGIAHDLKNIFTPILINTEIALEDARPDNPARPLLEEILHAARVGGDLVRQIMTFARRTPAQRVPVDVVSLVGETLSFLRSSIPSSIAIDHHFPAGPLEVMADPTQIRQVVMNLGSNAADAMKEHGGALEVDISCVDLDRDEASRISPELGPGTYAEIDVKDTGEGMDEETRQHIFEPFFTTKGLGEGTGLGLAVVQGIVKGHQGVVSVWSSPGKGSTFRVLLPKMERGCR